MIDDGFNFAGIKDPVFAPADQIVDRHRCCYFMTKNSVQPDNMYIICRIIDAVIVKYLFSNCLTHIVSFHARYPGISTNWVVLKQNKL